MQMKIGGKKFGHSIKSSSVGWVLVSTQAAHFVDHFYSL